MKAQKEKLAEIFSRFDKMSSGHVSLEQFPILIDTVCKEFGYPKYNDVQMKNFLRRKKVVQFGEYLQFVKMLYLLVEDVNE